MTDEQHILDTKIIFSIDFDEPLTLREYLQKLLLALFVKGEGFSGKRPFGNSGWEYDIAAALIRDGLIAGTLDEDLRVETFEQADFDLAMREAIEAL